MQILAGNLYFAAIKQTVIENNITIIYNGISGVRQRFSPHEIKHSAKKDKHCISCMYIILVDVKLPNLKAEAETAAFHDICYINASSLDFPCILMRK